MHVRDSGHRVYPEVLVGTDGSGFLNSAPVGEGWLRVVEPVVAEATDVVGISPGDTLGDLGASHTTACLDHLSADLVVLFANRALPHERVPVGVSATDNLDFVDVVRVVGGCGDTNPVHLADEDLVAEEVAAPETTVRVSEVLASLSGHIGELAKDALGRVVLLLRIVEMSGVLLDVVVTDNVLHQLEGVVVLVVDTWSIVEDTNVGVIHLVVTHHKERGSVDALLVVVASAGG